jgi:hypothetical protein
MAKVPASLSTNETFKSTFEDRQAGFVEQMAARVRDRAEAENVSYSSIMKALGSSSSAFANYWTGKRAWPAELIPKLAECLSTNVDALMVGNGDHDGAGVVAEGRLGFNGFPAQLQPPASASVLLPEIDIGYSMGGGLVIADHVDGNMVPFPRDWLRSLIRGTFDEVFIARGEGDSMQPTLLDGDIVIVDTAQNAITSQDRIWCVGYGELGMIKRLRAMPDRGIMVMSDNPAIQPFTAYDGELHIIGRVVWIGRKA